MESCLFIFFIVFVITIILSLNYVNNKNTIIAWEKFAVDTGLNITFKRFSSSPMITGTYGDFDYVLDTVTESCGDSSITYTIITMKFPCSVDYDLYIYQENFLSKVGKMFGGQDIQIGNKVFDESFIIKSQRPCKIDKLLTQDLQRKMLYGTHLINLSLSGNRLENKISGIIKEDKDLLYLSEIMLELAANACGKEITSQKDYRKKISDRSYETDKKPSKTDTPHRTFKEQSDFTSDFTDSYHEVSRNSSLKEEKLCPSCGAGSPAENKYCIDCGREI